MSLGLRGRFRTQLVLPLTALAMLLTQAAHGADGSLKLPNFDALGEKANKVVSITLDPALLGLATRFLDDAEPEDAAAKLVIAGLKGIYVKSYSFDTDFAYPKVDVDMVRKQLTAPGWQRLVEVRSRKEQSNVDIYISMDGNKANGLAIISSEPREFTIINIVGSIDLEKLHKLEGQFGIPKMQLEEKDKDKGKEKEKEKKPAK
jgi:hypothetical protein